MPRKAKIRWRKSDEQELKRVVRNFNSKISRISKKDPTLAKYLPERINVNDFKKTIETRQDYKREIESLSRFLKRGAENLVKSSNHLTTTAWEKEEIELKVKLINRKRKNKRNRLGTLDVTSQSVKTGLKRRDMGSVRMNAFNDKTFDFDVKDKTSWEFYKRSVNKQAMTNFQYDADEHLRENYIKGLFNIFGETDDIIELANNIREMDIKVFIERYFSEQEAEIDFIYDFQEAGFKKDILINNVWDEKHIEEFKKRT